MASIKYPISLLHFFSLGLENPGYVVFRYEIDSLIIYFLLTAIKLPASTKVPVLILLNENLTWRNLAIAAVMETVTPSLTTREASVTIWIPLYSNSTSVSPGCGSTKSATLTSKLNPPVSVMSAKELLLTLTLFSSIISIILVSNGNCSPELRYIPSTNPKVEGTVITSLSALTITSNAGAAVFGSSINATSQFLTAAAQSFAA